jgi:hypothetical protein
MSQFNVNNKSFNAYTELESFRRVQLRSGTAAASVEYAGAGAACIGVTLARAEINTPVAVGFAGRQQTYKVCASKSISAGATVYAAANGKVSDAAVGDPIGTAFSASTGDGAIIEVLFDNGDASDIDGASLANYGDTNGQCPIIVKKSVSNATGGALDVTVHTAARKLLVIDAWMVARDTQAANVTLKNGTNAFTGAVAKGATDDAIVRFDKIIAEYDEVAAAGTIVATISADGAADVFVSCLPIA